MHTTMRRAIAAAEAAIRRFRRDAILIEYASPDELELARCRELAAKAFGGLAFVTEDLNDISRAYEAIIARCRGQEPSDVFVYETGIVIDEAARAGFDVIIRDEQILPGTPSETY